MDLPKEEISDGEAENQNGSSLTEAIEIKPISIYTIQIASITDRSNIDNLIGELNDKELPHLIYSVDNKFKIFTYGSTRRSFIETKLEKVREHYPDAFISEMYLPKKTVRYNEDDKGVEEIIEAINNIIELIDKQSEEWYNYGGTSAYTDLLNKHEELIENLSGKIAEKNFSKEYFNKNAMEKALIYQLNNINTSLELIESSKEEHRIHSLYLDSLFRVVELTK